MLSCKFLSFLFVFKIAEHDVIKILAYYVPQYLLNTLTFFNEKWLAFSVVLNHTSKHYNDPLSSMLMN
jgi:hypothetical protein